MRSPERRSPRRDYDRRYRRSRSPRPRYSRERSVSPRRSRRQSPRRQSPRRQSRERRRVSPPRERSDRQDRQERVERTEKVEEKPVETKPAEPVISQEEQERLEKQRKRQEQLEKWRKEKAEKLKEAEPEPEVEIKPQKKEFTIGKKLFSLSAPKQQKPIKRVFLGEDDDDFVAAPVKKERKQETIEITQTIEEDPLEEFMANVENQINDLDKELLKGEGGEGLNKWLATKEDEDEEEEEPEKQSEPEDDVQEQLTQRQRRRNEILETDHTQINYEAFQKDFYIEPPEISHLTPEQVNQLRLDMDGIKIRGKDCPKPVERWSQFGLPLPVHEVIRRVLKYDRPSPIQSQAIPAIMSGRDVIGIARTGSGKTLAFLLPLFRHIKAQRPVSNTDGPIALIMTPTRELAVQIYKEARHFAKVLNIKAVACYGGAPLKDQIADLKRGAEIIIGTPGRMIDLLTANGGRVTNLRRVTYLVLDEADRMFDLGFEPQVMKIIFNIRPDKQCLLFSATFPKKMEALARKILKKPIEITVGARSVVSKDVTQFVEVLRDEDAKYLRLLEILGKTAAENPDDKTLIFVDRQDHADTMMTTLMKRGYPCASIHGGKDQADRDQTILDFKAGNMNILIATSVAARGLDVKDLKNVVNFDCPNHMEDYVHRCGRTGRAGNKGFAYTFITPDQERYAADIVKALTMSGAAIPFDLREMMDNFQAKVVMGQVASNSSGFGGKGLAQLEFHREVLKLVQKKTHGEEDEDVAPIVDESAKQGTALVVASAQGVTAAIAVAKERAAAQYRGQLQQQLKQSSVVKAINAMDSAFSAEFEINDYPMGARFKVNSRDEMRRMSQVSGAAITPRGIYVPPGKPVPLGERKLYLFIEADNQYAIERAKQEIKQCLQEGAMLTMDSGSSRTAGRYSVL
ncbi:ATP-dependent RNA helicase Prp11 [Gorgonomyces haynaldii]|nr:ATP-dependent RNA helicase Prp11 [Gorgonomyces haynaldii]